MTFQFDLTAIIVCSAACLGVAAVGMVCGFIMGRAYTLTHEPKQLKKDRELTLKALLSLLASTEQLNEDVDTHNNELQLAKQDLESVGVIKDDHLYNLQNQLVSNITRVVESNRKMENELVVSHYQIERQAEEIDRTRKEARTDGLCDVGNRKAFDEALKFMISRYERRKTPFGLLLVDIDHFKRINDTFGHPAGDKVLSSIGIALKKCVRPDDIVCRLGGDEFAVLLGGLTDESADAVGTRIRSTIETRDFSVGKRNQSTVVTMSMGLSPATPQDTAESIFARADAALYRSKELGRNRLYILKTDAFDGDLDETTVLEEARKISYEEMKASFMDNATLVDEKSKGRSKK